MCIGCNLSEEFSVIVCVQQGSCLSPLLFITVLEALSQEFCTGYIWEKLYVDHLVIIFDSLEGPLTILHHLQHSDQAMIRWMCDVATKDQVSWQDLLERMQHGDLAKVLRTHGLSDHGHVEISDGWQKVNPIRGRDCGRPKEIWTEVMRLDGRRRRRR